MGSWLTTRSRDQEEAQIVRDYLQSLDREKKSAPLEARVHCRVAQEGDPRPAPKSPTQLRQKLIEHISCREWIKASALICCEVCCDLDGNGQDEVPCLLHHAVDLASPSWFIQELLLRGQCDPELPGVNLMRRTLLHAAVAARNQELVDMLVFGVKEDDVEVNGSVVVGRRSKVCSPGSRDINGNTPLRDAVIDNQIKAVTSMLQFQGSDVGLSQVDSMGDTVFHWCIRERNPQMLELLLNGLAQTCQRDAKWTSHQVLNIRSRNGDTCLHRLVETERSSTLQFVSMLLRAGADPSILNADGMCAARICLARNRFQPTRVYHYLTRDTLILVTLASPRSCPRLASKQCYLQSLPSELLEYLSCFLLLD